MLSSSLEQTQHSSATLNEFELQRLTQAIQGLSHQQVNWASGLEAEAPVHVEGQQFTLQQALQNKLELTLLHPTVVANWASLAGSEKLLSLTDDVRKCREFAQDRQLIDLISEFPAQPDAEALINVLQPLQPRLYCISSSQQLNDDEVHLTVSELNFNAHGRSHQGTASNHLVHRLSEEKLNSSPESTVPTKHRTTLNCIFWPTQRA